MAPGGIPATPGAQTWLYHLLQKGDPGIQVAPRPLPVHPQHQLQVWTHTQVIAMGTGDLTSYIYVLCLER